MRYSIDLPQDVRDKLKRAALDGGAQSVKAWMEQVILERLGEPPPPKTWGHRNLTEPVAYHTEVKRDTQDTHDKPDTTPPAPKRTGSAMAQPKNPDLELPPNYLRKAGEVRKIPPFVGRKSGRSEDIEE